MLRLLDPPAGLIKPVQPGPDGVLRMLARRPAGSTVLTDLRALVLADVIRRNAEHRHHATASTFLITRGADSADAGESTFRADAEALNIRPAEQEGSADDLPDGEASLDSGEIAVGSIRIRAGDVAGDGPFTMADLAGRGLDPLALRLAFLSVRYREPMTLNWDTIAEAGRTLQSWRRLVAECAEHPSHPPSGSVTGQIAADLDENADTPAALASLAAMTPEDLPFGTIFETFLHTDQVLALDLPRSIGRL